MSKILGIDYGTRRIGLALSDDSWQYAFGLETFENDKKNNFINYLVDLCQHEHINKIVIGMPLDQNGQTGKKAHEVLSFVEKLKIQIHLPICYEDERFTSVMAKKLFHEAEKKYKKNKGMIDQGAAKLILQSYLDKKNG